MFQLIFVLIFFELLLSATWHSTYFRYGIPIYRQTLKANGYPGQPPSAQAVEKAVPTGIWTGIAVHQLDKDILAFREKLIEWRFFRMNYTPLMHGAMKFDKESGSLKVVGFLNGFPVFFVLMFIGFLVTMIVTTHRFSGVILIFPLFMVGLFTFIYSIQSSRFNTVAKTAVQLWSANEFESLSEKDWTF